jgi:hypothetical protein
MSDSDEPKSAGWDAITAALERLYPGKEPKHFGTVIPFALGGPDPIDGLSVYEVDEPVPHWHFITFGFSELHEKENDDPETSGFGFELTFRLKRGQEDEPPAFAMSVLQNLARYVFQSGNVFNTGDHMNLNGPIRLGSPTAITAICVAPDADLGSINTPNGALEFRQVVGITGDELGAVKAWNTNAFLHILRRSSPKLVTDLDRVSLLTRSTIDAEVREGSRRDGSSTGTLFVRQMSVSKTGLLKKKVGWSIGAYEVGTVARVLPARLCHQKPLTVTDGRLAVEFLPGQRPSAELSGSQLRVTVTPQLVEMIAGSLEPRRGSYSWTELPGIEVSVIPTDIRDTDGTVIETIG